ncbi:MAG: hypothetical protein PUK59_07405 [Actinomycetaceae bacterium]|nr:hypothetical protein [Actinomycetaceae bacterium]MDY5854885.1 hypothetical protein [Arcanobacterium sp.]
MGSRFLTVEGRVISITYPGSEEVPMVRVNIQRDDGLLVLVFQSRTTLEALEIGQWVKAQGNVVTAHGMPTIFNPRYTIEGHT